MDDLLLNPIQAEEVGVRFDTCPKRYYPDDPSAQLMTFPDGKTIPVLYDAALLYLTIIMLTNYEVQNCRIIQLS